MVDRKISEVVVELEAKVGRIAGIVQNTDNNIKLILDRLNRLSDKQKLLEPKAESVKALPQSIETRPAAMIAKPMRSEVTIEDSEELEEEFIHKGQRRGQRIPPPEQTSKVTVSQQLVLTNGKPVFLANISISDENGTLLKQVRTNNKGRWVAPLAPGRYIVKAVKRGEGQKIPIDLKYGIEIPDEPGPMEIPSPEMPAIYSE